MFNSIIRYLCKNNKKFSTIPNKCKKINVLKFFFKCPISSLFNGFMMKRSIFTLSILLLFFLIYSTSFAINKGVQILVKGKITDEFSGKPVEANIEFKTESGKKFKIKSNSIDGAYEQIFDSGENVQVIFTFWNIARKIDKFTVKDTTKYFEQMEDFAVKKYAVGTSLFNFNMFEPNSSNLKADAGAKIDSLKDMLLFSRNIKIELRTNGHDTYQKEKIVQEPPKATKKKSKKPEPPQEPKISIKDPDMNALKDLVDRRVQILMNYIKDWSKFIDRIKVAPDYSAGEPINAGAGDSYPDYQVIVTELKNPLD